MHKNIFVKNNFIIFIENLSCLSSILHLKENTGWTVRKITVKFPLCGANGPTHEQTNKQTHEKTNRQCRKRDKWSNFMEKKTKQE